MTREWIGDLARGLDGYPLIEGRAGARSFRTPSGRMAHSLYDPGGEARRQTRRAGVGPGSRPLVLGIGLGYVLDACLAAGAAEVLALEGDPAVLSAAGRRLSLAQENPVLKGANGSGAEWLADPRLLLYFAENDEAATGFFAREMKNEHGGRPLLVHPAAVELWRGRLPGLAALADDILSRRRSAAVQEPLLEQNAELNAEHLGRARCIDDLRDCWGAEPVAVCGAGPGLDGVIHRLSGPAGRRRLVALNTALPPLLAAGIIPDMAVATDPGPAIRADLPGPECAGVPLICFPGTDAGFVGSWPGPLVLALPEGPGLQRKEWLGQRPGGLRAGTGTVAGPALHAAARLSRGPLLLAGVDLEVGVAAYARGVRRPAAARIPDFAYSRRRMGELVRELAAAGREISALGETPSWMRTMEEPG